MPVSIRRTIAIPWIVAVVLAFGPGPLHAQESEDCLGCHAEEDFFVERDGRKLSMTYDEDRAAHSVHANTECIGCHVDLDGVESFPHAKRLKPAECGDCHDPEFESMAAYWNSTHGRLVKSGHAQAPRCQDCHGSHYIRKRTDELSSAYPLNVPQMCTQCHAEGSEVRRTQDLTREQVVDRYKDRIHGAGVFRQGLIVAAVCTTCHTAHAVLPANDPSSSIHKDKVNDTCARCHGDVPAVHRGIVAEELWARPGAVPICVDCHQPHSERRVAYGTNMSDAECLRCHGRSDLVDNASANGNALLIDGRKFRQSIHGHRLVACAQCHNSVTPSDDRSCASDGEKVNCATCHEDQVDLYRRGTHGQLHAEGDENAPTCAECHGTHDILESSALESPTHRRNVPALCARCHREGAVAAERHPGNDVRKVEHYRMSIHGKGLLESGLIASANCVDCHSAHMELPASSPESTVSDRNIVATCGKCHDGIYEKFRQSVHASEGNPDYVAGLDKPKLPHCNDCHSSHSVARTDLAQFKRDILDQCGSCHAEITETYFATYHGKVSALGDTVAARCHDCHGAHDILQPSDPASKLASGNIVATCGECHPGSHQRFTGYLAHATHHEPERYPALYWSFLAMTVLLVGVFSFFGLHLVAWLPRSWALRRQHSQEVATAHTGRRRHYIRFTTFNRTLHVMIIVSFLGLAVTGMILKFAGTGWAKVLASILGGTANAGWIHRVCAVITFAYMGLHLWDVMRRFYARKVSAWRFFFGPDTMIPTWRDVQDFAATMFWFLGKGPRPRYGKWTYWEKFDYFAVFWGVIVIGSSGLILWFPELFTHVLPGWSINVAMIIHSEEALLAAGFIFTIHFFNTHLRPEKFPMDRVVFTGKMTVDELKVDKPRLYDELVQSGELEKYLVEPPSPAAERVAKVFGFTALTIGVAVVVLIVQGIFTTGY